MPVDAALVRITLVPCGVVPLPVLGFLKDGLQKELTADVTQAEGVPVPPWAYDSGRRQYQAEAFLPLLAPHGPGNKTLVLGVTTVDLFVPDLNFVFGLASYREKCAIISLARLHPEFYGQPSIPHLFEERALKEAVHELGHLMGLEHCSNPSCIMFFSNSVVDTDRKGPGFCPDCRRYLKRYGIRGP